MRQKKINFFLATAEYREIYFKMLKETRMIVTDMQASASRNTISAIFSKRSLRRSLTERIERNERIQLVIKKMAAKPVLSSMIVASPNFEILMEVRMIRQNPSKLEDVLRICGDLPFAGINFQGPDSFDPPAKLRDQFSLRL